MPEEPTHVRCPHCGTPDALPAFPCDLCNCTGKLPAKYIRATVWPETEEREHLVLACASEATAMCDCFVCHGVGYVDYETYVDNYVMQSVHTTCI